MNKEEQAEQAVRGIIFKAIEPLTPDFKIIRNDRQYVRWDAVLLAIHSFLKTHLPEPESSRLAHKVSDILIQALSGDCVEYKMIDPDVGYVGINWLGVQKDVSKLFKKEI